MFGGIPKTSPLQSPEPAFSPWAFKLGCSWPWGHPSTLNVCLGPAASLPGHVRPHSLPARLGFSEGSVKKPHAELCHVVHSRGHQGAPDRGPVSSGADSCLEAPVHRSAPCPSCDGRVWPWTVSCLPCSPKPLLRAGMGKRSTSRPRFPPDACLQRLLAWLSTGRSRTHPSPAWGVPSWLAPRKGALMSVGSTLGSAFQGFLHLCSHWVPLCALWEPASQANPR